MTEWVEYEAETFKKEPDRNWYDRSFSADVLLPERSVQRGK